jgi:hypothetical protein
MGAPITSCVAVALLAIGCGGAVSSADDGAADPGQASAVDVADQPAASGEPVASDVPVDPVGSWENGSCGDRDYNRRVNFLASGSFTALDLVAPCPPKAQCVWSGIIRWSGTWELDGELIRIVVKQDGERMPEALPTEFVVLARDPLSIGERIGGIVCPYRRVD